MEFRWFFESQQILGHSHYTGLKTTKLEVTIRSPGYDNKLNYRRDSASRRQLRRSRSFKVINFGHNWKPVCDFLLVINTSLHLMRTVLQLSRSNGKITLYYIMIIKSGYKKLETSLCRAVQKVFRHLEPFRRATRVWRTDGRTDRTAVSKSEV